MTRIAARSRTRAAGLVALFVISATALTFAQFQGFRAHDIVRNGYAVGINVVMYAMTR